MKLNTIDGAFLMSQPLRPPNFVVDTLIAQGLHILAGSPKVGKSWLALWLAVTVAKGELVWGMGVKRGTTLYLCLEDSVLRIQNRLFEITEDAPSSVHFCTECAPIGQGLEEQVEIFLAAHPDTVLVIIDTLQMVRPVHDATYANDYRDLSVLKRLADKHGIAILLIHHLRKEKADDVFHRISGTTAISGAVDSSFILVEEKRGSGRAKLSCVGRDIEYRELELQRGSENVWELVSDSGTQAGQPGEQIVTLLSAFLTDRNNFIGTPTELSEQIDPDRSRSITPKKVARIILQSVDALNKAGITAVVRRSNGKRLIELHSADRVDLEGAGKIVPIAPAAVDQPSGEGATGAVETDSSLLGGKSSLSPLLPLTNRLERARRGLWRRIPPFWEGKHRVRLYAGHRSGALPRTRPLRGKRRSHAESKKERDHHPAGDAPYQENHSGAGKSRWPDGHRLPVLQRIGKRNRAGGRAGAGAH